MTFAELWMVSIEHLLRVWLASSERLPFRTCLCSNCWDTCTKERVCFETKENILTLWKYTRGRTRSETFQYRSHCKWGFTLKSRPWSLLYRWGYEYTPSVFTRHFTLNTSWYYLDLLCNDVSIWLHCCCVVWEGWSHLNPINHTSKMAFATQTNRFNLVCNKLLLFNRFFCGDVCVVNWFYEFLLVEGVL